MKRSSASATANRMASTAPTAIDPVEQAEALKVDQRQGGGDENGAERRHRHVLQRSREEEKHQRHRGRGHEPHSMGSAAGRVAHGGARVRSADGEALRYGR